MSGFFSEKYRNSIWGIVMTTEKKSENTATPAAQDNKAVFGPLGKYAIIAVIMVSVIVTTAIMLDRQLGTVDQQIAAIEEEVAEMHAVSADATIEEVNTAEAATTESTTAAKAEIKEEVTTAVVPVTKPVEVASAEVLVTQANPTAPAVTAPAVTVDVVTEVKQNTAQENTAATAKTTAQARQTQHAKEYQARIEAYKAEQKQYMTDMFARIKALESKQLDRYKAKQDGQISHLREQIAQQQQMIDALVLRNKDLFELRAANVQRNQDNRAQVLNRI
jgi:hypothetical protein